MFYQPPQIQDRELMNVLRRKVKLRQPYVGVFLKKNNDQASDVVSNMSEMHVVGTFCRIEEFQDLGDKLRMIVIAHRRIRAVNQLSADHGETTIKIFNHDIRVSTVDDDEAKSDAAKRRQRRKRFGKSDDEKPGRIDVKLEPKTKPRLLAEGEKQNVLMVEVENVKKEEFKETDEVKALTQEVIKTLREIIAMNSLYRENLQSMINLNQRVVNNPVYLCDLGASLAAADSNELQEVLHEEDVSICIVDSTPSLLIPEFRFTDFQTIKTYVGVAQKGTRTIETTETDW